MVFYLALVVEHHGGRLGGCEGWPLGKPTVIGVSGAGETDPRLADLGRKLVRFRTAAGHILAPVHVIENKWNLASVYGSRPTIQNRRLPGEQKQVGGRNVEGAFQFGLPD